MAVLQLDALRRAFQSLEPRAQCAQLRFDWPHRRLRQLRRCRRGEKGAVSPPVDAHLAGTLDRRDHQANADGERSEEHTSELQSHSDLVCRLLLEKKKK